RGEVARVHKPAARHAFRWPTVVGTVYPCRQVWPIGCGGRERVIVHEKAGRAAWLAAISLVLTAAAPAQEATPAGSAPRPRVGLVLSGGGARGAAHIGVLKVLEEYHVPVDAI